MLYIANFIEKKKEGTRTTTTPGVSQLIDADDISSATTKLNNYYASLETENISYKISINNITPTIE
tara:strand:+ start:1907 stop:2104 length:198 start_codon:yes stop_codon:yes gene_type:complete